MPARPITSSKADEIEKSYNSIYNTLKERSQWSVIAEDLGAHLQGSIRSLPDEVRRGWKQAWDVSLLAATYQVPLDKDVLGNLLVDLFDGALNQLHSLADWASACREHGFPIKQEAEIFRLISEIETMRSEALDNWPWTLTQEEWDEAMAEFERGDSLPADESFAEIAGVSKDEWLRRVEAHKERPDDGEAVP